MILYKTENRSDTKNVAINKRNKLIAIFMLFCFMVHLIKAYEKEMMIMHGGFMEYFNLILKCIFFYFVIIAALRLMGKREVGELSVFDIVIYLVMSELLALSISESESSIFKALVPLVTLALLQIVLSKILLSYQTARNLVDGKPVILIDHGKINQSAMRKERYSIDDLMQQLRNQNVATIGEVAFAILENNGSLSVLTCSDCKARYPFPLIQDGIKNREVMQVLDLDDDSVLALCKANGCRDEKEVFIALWQKNDWYFLKKQEL